MGYLGEFEQLILFSVLLLEENAYGVAIRETIEERTGRAISSGAIYTALGRLEERYEDEQRKRKRLDLVRQDRDQSAVDAALARVRADAADPNVQADWFVAGDGPYRTTAAIGASLMVAFVLAGITQGALAGDVGGMIRRMVLDLPMSVLGIVGLVTFTQVLIRLTDYLSTWVLSSFEDDITDYEGHRPAWLPTA